MVSEPLPSYPARARPRTGGRIENYRRIREVYFIQAETLGLIKIGAANYAAERLARLQTGSPDRLRLLGVVLCENYGELESDLHCQFALLRSHGEWHRPGDELMAYIRDHAVPPRTRAEAANDPNEWDEVLGA